MESGTNRNNQSKKLLIASPRGFCAGVKRANDALDQAIKTYPDKTVYCYHQIVHNTYVVKYFENKGVVFVNNVSEVPKNSILVFSSHGVSPEIRQEAQKRRLITIDATCPYVTKTHFEVKRYASLGNKIIYIGQRNHDEAMGTAGEAPDDTIIVQSTEDLKNLKISPKNKTALVTQTTLSFDETEDLKQSIKAIFPNISEPSISDICAATQNRQNGIKQIVKLGAKIVIVLGSKNSANSNKLKTVAEKSGAKAYLLDDISEINPTILEQTDCIGLSAGASLPENKITEAISWFKNRGVKEIKEVVVAEENIIFPEVKI